MSPLVLWHFTAILLVVYSTSAKDIEPSHKCNASQLLIESDSDIKKDALGLNSNSTRLGERSIVKPLSTTATPMIFNPTPPITPLPQSSTTAVEEIGSVSLPNLVALPPPATTESPESATFCGKMGNCYQWFDDEWALTLSGYKRCDWRDERRAKRYCCISSKQN